MEKDKKEVLLLAGCEVLYQQVRQRYYPGQRRGFYINVTSNITYHKYDHDPRSGYTYWLTKEEVASFDRDKLEKIKEAYFYSPITEDEKGKVRK